MRTDSYAKAVRNGTGTQVLQSLQSTLADAADKRKDSSLPFSLQEATGLVTQAINGFAPKMRRNERCFCGSGKRYKHCHGRI